MMTKGAGKKRVKSQKEYPTLRDITLSPNEKIKKPKKTLTSEKKNKLKSQSK